MPVGSHVIRVTCRNCQAVQEIHVDGPVMAAAIVNCSTCEAPLGRYDDLVSRRPSSGEIR